MSYTTGTALSRRTALAGLGAIAAGAAAGATPAHAADPAQRGRQRPLIGPIRNQRLHIMTYNIRFDADGTPAGDPDYWPDRRPLLRELLDREKPTVLGIQEALHHQLATVAEGLGPGYRRLGHGREGGSHGEYSAIFYDATRLRLMEWDQTWLSDTPNVIGSSTWGNGVTRIVVWARFADTLTGKTFVHINTHFDHESERARVSSAAVIVGLAGRFADLPVIVTGDFNAAAGESGAYTRLTAGGDLADTWNLSGKRLSREWGTFPGYEDPVDGSARIDWVLASPDKVKVHSAGINVWARNGRFPSDHAPVQALISL